MGQHPPALGQGSAGAPRATGHRARSRFPVSATLGAPRDKLRDRLHDRLPGQACSPPSPRLVTVTVEVLTAAASRLRRLVDLLAAARNAAEVSRLRVPRELAGMLRGLNAWTLNLASSDTRHGLGLGSNGDGDGTATGSRQGGP